MQTFPSASFGRSLESSESAVDSYQVLFETAGFPPSARKALEQLAASVQWTGGGLAERYGDCFALWPVFGHGGVLAARLIDAGRDRLGRPHALRVDAVYLDDPELLGSFAQLANTTHADAWPAGAWQGPPDGIQLEVSRVESALAAALESSAAEGRGLPRVLVAGHANFRATGFDVVHDARAATDLQSQLPPSLETFRCADEEAQRCFEQIDKTIRALQEAKRELESYLDRKTAGGRRVLPLNPPGGMKPGSDDYWNTTS